MKPSEILVLGLATARLTRLMTSDHIGEWFLVGPFRKHALEAETAAIRAGAESSPNYPASWQMKVIHGLDCPFCVGFWLGLVTLASAGAADLAATRGGRAGRGAQRLWRWLMSGLALNYVVGHVSARLDH